ncbi:hypothetical protein P280DRAFT_462833 [Massarina eburnea CBS 473.64]|uniref:Ubiquitin 3 binding protein But2 C-terminal domain-containing protein n=1 Tax=Massarina eburnea CBS 473.64 TaxID=1395130 RepID=A0A6A6RID3_9PLEO|nr:hypothetical protein P280DRAFT_462833 [Massarina eburnea CBS 473.64]
MKTFAILSALAASTLAFPTTPISSLFSGNIQCPANKVQPDGKLPVDSISTSLLVQISAKEPNTAFPASDWAKITPNDFCTIFNLELPVDKTQGKVCNLVFDFPNIWEGPGLFKFYGSGDFTFTGYAIGVGAQNGTTTYNNQPSGGPSPPNPPPTLQPGNSYVVNSAPCGIPEGTPSPVTVSGSLCSSDTTFIFKQSDVVCPLGFYVVLTDA